MFRSLIYETHQVLYVKLRRKEKIKKSTHLYFCILLIPRVKVVGAEDAKLTKYCPCLQRTVPNLTGRKNKGQIIQNTG